MRIFTVKQLEMGANELKKANFAKCIEIICNSFQLILVPMRTFHTLSSTSPRLRFEQLYTAFGQISL